MIYDQDNDSSGADYLHIPTDLIASKHALVFKLEQHASVLLRAAMSDTEVTLLLNQEQMLEISSAILQLLLLVKAYDRTYPS